MMRTDLDSDPALDVAFARQQFPAFAEPALQGQAFFENAGGSYACRQVIARLTRYYHQRKVQPYGPYAAARLGGEEMDEARRRLAALLGVNTDEVAFGPSTTQNVYVMAQAFGEWLNPKEAVIVSNQDHEANSGPWRRLAERGIDIREWRIDPHSGLLSLKDLADLLDESVRLVCFPHCSNVIGHINPVAQIAALAHAAGAFVCVDGVSAAPHGLPNVGELGADIYLFSTYKTYGPHQGCLVMRRALGMQLPNQGHYFNAESLYKRFTPAGPDHAQVAACAGIADYIEALAAHHGITDKKAAHRCAAVGNLMRRHETALLPPLLEYLGGKSAVRLLGPAEAESRVPTLALATEGDAGAIATELAKRGIMAGSGDFYAARLLQAMGLSAPGGVLRLSFVHYTSPDEVAHLLDALEQVLP